MVGPGVCTQGRRTCNNGGLTGAVEVERHFRRACQYGLQDPVEVPYFEIIPTSVREKRERVSQSQGLGFHYQLVHLEPLITHLS